MSTRANENEGGSVLLPPATVLVDYCTPIVRSNGGIARYFSEVLPRVSERFPQIRLVLLRPFGLRLPWSGRGVKTIRLLRVPKVSPVFLRLQAKLAARIVRPDIFHSTYYSDNPSRSAATVVTVYDMIDEHFFDGFSGNGAAFRLALRRHIQEAAHNIAISETTRDDIIRYAGVDPNCISVSHLALSTGFERTANNEECTEFRAKWGVNSQYLLYVGTPHAYKNLSTMLEGWCEYRRSHQSQIRLMWAGQGELPHHCHELLIRNRVLDQFIHAAGLSDIELRCAYKGASAFVFPSLWEGFGLPILEAAANDVPLILSDIAAFREVAGTHARYFDPYDPKDLARVMHEVLASGSDGNRNMKSRQLVDRYSWDKAAAIHADVYSRVAVQRAIR